MEKPYPLPLCHACNETAIWVDNVPGKEYCYCRDCKCEVTPPGHAIRPDAVDQVGLDQSKGMIAALKALYTDNGVKRRLADQARVTVYHMTYRGHLWPRVGHNNYTSCDCGVSGSVPITSDCPNSYRAKPVAALRTKHHGYSCPNHIDGIHEVLGTYVKDRCTFCQDTIIP